MKVKELIRKLEELDDDYEVKTKERYCEGWKPVTSVEKKFASLDEVFVYIG